MKPQNIGTFAALLGTILLLTTIVAPTVNAQESVQASVSVNITGELTSIGDPSIRILIGAFAIGDPNALTGRGANSGAVGIGDPTLIPPGPCTWTLTGAIGDPNVRLAGSATNCLNTRLVGAPVSLIANFRTGEIAFSIGDFQFTGIGNVVIGNPNISVSVTGQLTSIGDPNDRVFLNANAIGDPNQLTGRGTVTGIGDPHIDIAVGDPNQFGLTGAVEPDTRIVRLSGFVTFAVDPRLIGTPVSLIGDPNSRSISFSLGSDTFTGIGNVVVGDPNL